MAKANAEEEVRAALIHRRFRKKVSIRTIANAMHSRGYYFRKLREKPILTPDDVKERYEFAKRFRHKSAAWWLRHVHLHWDCKCFKVATTGKRPPQGASGHSVDTRWTLSGHYSGHNSGHTSGHHISSARMQNACLR